MLVFHIATGLLALLAGAMALIARKGSHLHRISGRMFALAMLLMTASAIVMAAFLRPNIGNVIAGSLTFYLVLTGVLAVARSVDQVRALLTGMMLVGLTIGVCGLLLGNRALAMPNGAIDQIPAFAYFMFGTIGCVAGLLDLRMLRLGQLPAKQRLTRHLWRMGYAMWIATTSFFFGQADEFPAAVRASGVLALPVLAVTLTMLYWLARVVFAKTLLRRAPSPTREAMPAFRS
ncbi:MAG: DUF2306 domain-containing protein [Pseudomarimonas sp.]